MRLKNVSVLSSCLSFSHLNSGLLNYQLKRLDITFYNIAVNGYRAPPSRNLLIQPTAPFAPLNSKQGDRQADNLLTYRRSYYF